MEARNRVIALVGLVDDDDVAIVANLAKARGFHVFSTPGALRPETLVQIRAKINEETLPLPTWRNDQLHQVLLPDEIDNLLAHEMVEAVLQLNRIRNAGQLTRLTFAEFMRPQQGLTNNFYARAQVLEFMIQHGISFSDFNPAAAFPTRVKDVQRLTGQISILNGAGIYRLEILVFFTRDQLLELRNYSYGRLGAVQEALKAIDLTLSPGH